jgi:sugar phosphate isomerase/epimerase
MKISIASYSFHGLHGQKSMDVFGYMESIRHRYHIRGADIWNGMIPTLDAEFLTRIKAGLEERELKLANLCVDGPILWEDDAAKREANYKLMLEWLKASVFLKAKTIRIDAGGREKTWTDEQFDLIVKRYQEYAKFAHDNGFRVGPENHWGTENEPDNMKRLCEAVNHPGFGVLVHFKNTGEEKFAKWAMHSHISYDVCEKELEPKMKILRDAGYKGYWSVEHHSGKNEYDEVAIQLARIRMQLLAWEGITT